MDKIKALLQQSGISEDFAQQICESLVAYKTSVREQYEKDYTAKVSQVKKVCVEEVEEHKRELARRLQIFCETKGAAIEAHLAKQSAISESEALSKLKTIKASLTGVKLNGQHNGSSTTELENVSKKLRIAVEQRDRAMTTANRQTAIANKIIKQNRKLATENEQLSSKLKVLQESRTPRTPQIDTRRRKAKPVSTRPTLVESQDRRPPAKKAPSSNGYDIFDIASKVDEDLI